MLELTTNLTTEEIDNLPDDEFEYDKIRVMAVSQSIFDQVWRKRKGKNSLDLIYILLFFRP